MLNHWSFKRRVAALVFAALAGLVVMTATSAVRTKNEIESARRDALRTAVESAYSIAAGYQAQALAGTMSTEAAQQAATAAIKASRYGGPEGKSDYFYVFGMDGVGVMHPIKAEWTGKPMMDAIKHGQGRSLVRDLVDQLKASPDGRAFVPTEFPRPGQTTPVPKLQYVMELKGWNWLVGSGLYMDDVDAQVRRALMGEALLGVALLLAIGGLGALVARSVLRQLGGEPAEAMAVMQEVANGNLAIEQRPRPVGSLMDGLQKMTASLRDTVGQVRTSTDSITTASSEIATGNADL
ncbi:methyl-accepting chemotaxis protein, partial [uncultured Methylibium sp.]|uniref:cache domain-containing protein n=1 Tax=uncultured Methylibium sp. TaxID=381093 RepID=UPI0025EFC197